MEILVGVLALNTFFTALYIFVKAFRHQKFGIAWLFLFLPVVGFVLYFTPYAFQRFLRIVGIDKDSVLITAFDIEALPERPNIEEELNIVSVEDALTISDNEEKRALLLAQLKRDLLESYKILRDAEHDEDSESVHYVASAKMEIYRLRQQAWLDVRKDFEQDPQNPELFHEACEALEMILDSEVFSPREQPVYMKHYCDIIKEQIMIDRSIISTHELEIYLGYLIVLERYAEAERLWTDLKEVLRSEISYNLMLKLAYLQRDRTKFKAYLDDLGANKQVRLSSEGLEQLRYWFKRLNGEPVIT